MRARAAGLGGHAPRRRRLGIAQPILQVDRAHLADFAELAVAHQRRRGRGRGGAAVIVPDQRRHLLLRRQRRHLARLGGVHRQRLLGQHDLAGVERLDGQRVVAVVGRRDVDDVDVLAREDGVEIGRGLLPAQLLGRFLERAGAAADQHLGHHLVGAVGEVAVHLAVGVGMGAAHEGVPDQGDVERGLVGHADLGGWDRDQLGAIGVRAECWKRFQVVQSAACRFYGRIGRRG